MKFITGRRHVLRTLALTMATSAIGFASATAERCWLSNNLLDLKTESAHVRQVAKDYLTKLASLGAAGFRFDAAKHIETEFFADVLPAVPGRSGRSNIRISSPFR